MPNPTTLVISGGGTNGTAHVGAILELQRRNYLNNLSRIDATSAGAFVSVALAVKFTEEETLDFLNKVKFENFLHAPNGHLGKLKLFYKRYGLYSGKIIRENVNAILKNKTGIENATFLDLYRYSGIEFCVYVTNFTKNILCVFSYRHTPNARVDIIIQASMAAPFLFEFVQLKKLDDGSFVFSEDGDVFGDGGLKSNFPIDASIKDCKARCESYNSDNTLGLFLIENEELIKMIHGTAEPSSTKFNHFFHYFFEVIKCFYNQTTELLRHSNTTHRIIFINIEGRPSFKFSIDTNEKTRLLKAGEKAAQEFIEKWENTNKNTPIRSKL